jgi:hypothetical protein
VSKDEEQKGRDGHASSEELRHRSSTSDPTFLAPIVFALGEPSQA